MRFVLTVAVSVGAFSLALARDDPPTPADVRALVAGDGSHSASLQLKEYGPAAFPAYEVILADPKSEPHEVSRVLSVLVNVKADRKRFVELAAAQAAHEKSRVRFQAVRLLQQIGTPAEGSVLVALLGDGDNGVAYGAAEALAATGGRREVAALDAWLKVGTTRRDDGDFLIHVKKCRDELDKRLKDTAAKNLHD